MEANKSDRDKVKTGICDFLLSYDCPSEYIGFPILIDLLKAAIDNYAELAFNLKSIYYRVAKERKITRLCIERNLTTLLDHWAEAEKFKELFDKTSLYVYYDEVCQEAKSLLIETKESEKDAVIALLEEEMHQVASLKVPLEVGTAWGANWYDAH